MSVLSSLAGRHARFAAAGEVPIFGYSTENIGFIILLDENGKPVGQPVDWRQGEGKKRRPRPMAVPASFKRPGITPKAFFLWDNTAFALGVTGSESKDASARFAAFKERHERELAGGTDAGLLALRRFVESWTPEDFERLGWPAEMKDQNVVFALEDEYRQRMIHDREAAIALWTQLQASSAGEGAVCLITGEKGPIARLHPAIKGVWGAQTAGASLVSFNLDAFTSYGHEQGENAPVSEVAAAEYGAVLNHLLRQNSPNRIQIGDASTVFWAEAPDQVAADEAEDLFAGINSEQPAPVDEGAEAGKVGIILGKIRKGLPLESIMPDLPKDVRFYVLGLAPNAARLSVRFYIEDDFAELGRRYLEHLERLAIEPGPRFPAPPLWRLLLETATLRKRENVPPNLAGEWLRAILTGHPYPLTLLSTTLMRIRSDADINVLRVGILKSLLIRNFDMEVPVAFDPDNKKLGYLLGRLFATYEQVQGAALGRVNASVRDKFYASASSTPRRVFSLLDKGSAAHFGKLRKERPGQAVNLEKLIGSIMEHFDPAGDPFPDFLPQEDQGLFAVGYYQQRSQFFKTRDDANPEETPA